MPAIDEPDLGGNLIGRYGDTRTVHQQREDGLGSGAELPPGHMSLVIVTAEGTPLMQLRLRLQPTAFKLRAHQDSADRHVEPAAARGIEVAAERGL
jgi:hypothetical protein